jgi:hypothetical protein
MFFHQTKNKQINLDVSVWSLRNFICIGINYLQVHVFFTKHWLISVVYYELQNIRPSIISILRSPCIKKCLCSKKEWITKSWQMWLVLILARNNKIVIQIFKIKIQFAKIFCAKYVLLVSMFTCTQNTRPIQYISIYTLHNIHQI